MSKGPTKSERKALMTLGDEQIAVRVDEHGFLKRTVRRVRLNYGTELYAATRNPKGDDKVAPYQPGYMKLVSAMGGQLLCPPTVRDSETGEPRANPEVETYPGTQIIRSVKATAVCAVRNPMTGEPVMSMQTIAYDAEHVLRQALLKLQNDDAVRIMSQGDWDEARKAGELRGWSLLPLTPPFAMIAANMRMQGVREAWQTFLNQSATARQRACSKAERLAADHNPITRMTLEFGQLVPDVDEQGNTVGPSFTVVPVVAWVEKRGQVAMGALLERLAKIGQGAVSDQVELLTAPTIDVSVEDVGDEAEAEAEDVTLAPHRVQSAAVYQQPGPPPQVTTQVQQAPAPAARQPVEPVPAERSPEFDRVLSRVLDLEAEVSEATATRLRGKLGLTDDASAGGDIDKLRAYQSALFAAMEDGQ